VTEPARDRAIRLFAERFGRAHEGLVRAPGRVNLIGEHTDYNDGFVLPVAIDRELWIALGARADRTIVAVSEDVDEPVRFGLDRFDTPLAGWGGYVQGAAWALQTAGEPLGGWDGAVASDLPVGAGLSSSAALELATLQAFHAVGGSRLEPDRLAVLARQAENDWVGVASGIMDQMICAAGRRGHALLLDCRTLEQTHVPLPEGVDVVVLDTTTRRELAGSAYNDRRRACEAAAAALGVPSLRDATAADLAALDGTTLRRARHVVTENARTLETARSLLAGDAAAAGRLMRDSHRSLRDDFEVSGPALDAIVEAADAAPGCLGARMTGAGFAGCAVALVAGDAAAGFFESVAGAYRRATGMEAGIYRCSAVDGASTAA
jgi:galactokinase